MKLVLNGEPREVEEATSVDELLRFLGFADTPVVVEHNGRALFPREFAETRLDEGDRLEIVRVVAGG